MSGIVFRFAEAAAPPSRFGRGDAAQGPQQPAADPERVPMAGLVRRQRGREILPAAPLRPQALARRRGRRRAGPAVGRAPGPSSGTGDLIDYLEDIRRYAIGRNMDEFRGRVHAALPDQLVSGGRRDRYLEGAIKEMRQEEDPAFQFILYGHTHVARQEYLSGELDWPGPALRQHRHLSAAHRPRGTGEAFGSAKQMTMTFAYGEDEDTDRKAGGPSLDAWAEIRRAVRGGGSPSLSPVPGHQLGGADAG